MDIHAIAVEIDREIVLLQQIRALLIGSAFTHAKPSNLALDDSPKKRNLSPEGRARIVAAQKKRWVARLSKNKQVA